MMFKLIVMYWQIVDCVRISTFCARGLAWSEGGSGKSFFIFHSGAANSCEYRAELRVSAHNWRQKTNHIANWNRRVLPPREGPREAFLLLKHRHN